MGSWTATEPQRLSVEGAVDRLEVSLRSATVTVVAADGPARIEVTRVSEKRPVVIEHDDGLLRLRHDEPDGWPSAGWWRDALGQRHHAEVSIAVPPTTFGRLRVANGAVVASGLRAGADLYVTNGKITMLGLDGDVTARVISGTIEALRVGGALTMDVTSGEIALADSAAHRVSARITSGVLTCDLDNPHGSDIRLQTTSGEITVRVREDSDLDVHLQAVSGRLSSNFEEITPQAIAGARSAHGRLGAGTGQLHASAVSGNIALLARPVESEEPA